ncbi:hypothetical protein B0T20DRAFT_489567 [Sordaria brevicollis]|uniref:Uncharacterized protein n=1 Tax=Sordaria brevicollis TaxID=83679 RepID=A0AAE0U556_SORBR|nr:hypothetical protein B0T20DRAFT_489567 [Sordaria brevicollis]
MRLFLIIHLALASLASIALAEDVLFPYMHGLKYSEYNETVKLGLSAHVCKDEAEWYSMTTADFAKYKAIIVPDCLCNSSLSTIKFLDDTKKVWSPAVTGNMILIGTDPSFHAKWFGLAGAYAMMKDAISHVTLGNSNGTGMYFSLSCYYQSNSSQMAVQSLSEIGNFQVRGNLSHPCLNDAHLVASSDVMTSLNDSVASNWNCSVHEVFSDYPREGSGGFNALAVAVNASGPGQQEFADGTVGIPYIIARGATPVGCGNNVTDTKFHEQCDDGKANGTPESLCSASCKCIYGMISPGVCRPKPDNTTSTTTSQEPTSSLFSNSSSTIALSTSPVPANSTSFSRPIVTVTASLPSSSVAGNLTFTNSSSTPNPTGPENTDPITVTVFPPSPSSPSSSSPPPTVTVTPVPAPPPLSSTAPPNNSSSMTYGNGTMPLAPPGPPPTVTVFPSEEGPSGSPPGTVTVLPPTFTMRPPPPVEDPSGSGLPPVTVTAEPSSPSNSGGPPSGSGPVTVTALPPSASANGTSPLPSSDSSPLSSNPAVSGPVTVTALPPSISGTPPSSSRPSLAGNSSSSLSSQSSGGSAPSGPVTVTASAPGSPSNSNTPASPSDTSMANPGMGSSSGSPASGSASGSGTATGPQSGAPPVTVTAQPPSGGGSMSDTPGPSSDSASPSSGGPVTVTAQPSGGNSASPSSGDGSSSDGSPGSSSDQPDASSSPSGSGSGSGSGSPTIPPQLSVTVVPSSAVSGGPNAESPDTSGNPGALPPSTTNSGQYPSATSSGDSQTASGDPISGNPSSTGVGAGAGDGAGSSSGSASQLSSTRPPFSNQTATLTYPETLASSPSGSQTTGNPGSSSGAVGSLTTVTATPVPISGSGSATMPGGSSSSAGNGNGSGSGGGDSASATGSAQVPGGTGTAGNPSNGGPGVGGGGSPTSGPSGSFSSGQPVGGTASGSQTSGASLTGTAGSGSGSGSPTTLPGPPSGGSSSGSGSGGEASHTGGSSGSGNGTMTGGNPSMSDGAGSGATGTGSPISGSGVTSPFPAATSVNCDSWIGVEIIYMIEEVEVCPEGATVTTTSTSTTATMSRSICQTSATNLPCYPCIMGPPSSSDHSFTVTRTSCRTATEPTVTVTFQPCSTCTTSTYTGTVPGHTPGGPCHACSHYGEPDATSTVTVIDPGVSILPSSEVWFSALNPTTIVTRTGGPAASVSKGESDCSTATLVGVGGGYPWPSGPAASVSVPGTSPAIVPIHTDPPAPGSNGNEHDPEGGYTYGPPPPLHDPQPSGSAPGVPGAPGAGNGGVSTGDSHGPPATTATTPAQTPGSDPVNVTNTAVPYRPTTAVGPDYGPVLAGAPGSNIQARRASAGVVLGLLGYVVMVLLG